MLNNNFLEIENDFCLRIRTRGASKLPQGVSLKRMRVYEQLLFDNMKSLLEPCFPVLRGIVSIEDWCDMVSSFLKDYSCQTPLFHQVSANFVNFLMSIQERLVYPFLAELAHYEWLELYMELIDASIGERIVYEDDTLWHRHLTLSPCACIHHYQYEVDKIGMNKLPKEKTPFSVAVYRNVNDTVNFMRINSLTCGLIMLIEKQELTPLQALKELQIQYASGISEESFMVFGRQTIVDLVKAPVLVSRD